MISEHNEIEAKMAADGVANDAFWQWMVQKRFWKSEIVAGPDTYYERDDSVVRHRSDRRDGSHELTVKRRKSTKSTRDREEIDLHFAKRTQGKDVDAFLKATGYTPVFTLVKIAHIFWVEDDDVPLTVVIYDVWQQPPGKPPLKRPPADAKRFIEVEVEKGSTIAKFYAKTVLDKWVKELRQQFGLSEPLNDSLYEIYSGKRYSTV